MPGTYHCLKLHVVFSTKNRQPLLTADVRDRVHTYLAAIIRGERGVALQIGGVNDHVHVLLGWRTDQSIATLLRLLKSNSSRWIHERIPTLQGFAWQEGYSVFSVSQSRVEAVRRYILGQAEHHRTRSFQDELLQLLGAHRVEFDPKYVFD